MKDKKHDNKIDISIVIPAKNEEEFLKLCIENIIKAVSKYKFEIIVVDNESDDNTSKIAEIYGCRVVQNEKRGAASSRNIGASIAEGEFVAFIDADCIIEEKWFEYTKEHFQNQKVVAVGTKASINFNNATWVERTVFYLNNRKSSNISKKAAKVRWIGTSNMLIKKIYFDEVGGFNEDFITCEDYNLCERLSQLGDIIMDRRILTMHLRESKTLKELYGRELWRGQDNLKNWKNCGYKLHESLSVLVPGIFLICIILGVLSTILFDYKNSIIFFLLMLSCPLLMVVLRSPKAFLNPVLLIQCIAVSISYLLGRGIAIVRGLFFLWKSKRY